MRLIVYKTDKGHYSVRPYVWGGAFNKKGELLEEPCRHLALFEEEDHAYLFLHLMNEKEK